MDDPFNLDRFLNAQAGVFPQVLDELRAGLKRSHWIWFIFPQMKGLGYSPQSEFYGIGSIGEAQAYLRHPHLGPRLVECVRLILGVQGRTIQQILGYPDDLKFRSSMTLFARADAGNPVFQQALDRYFAGQGDAITLELLG
jgi:uncharacterized protein (DUF1810 family)